MGTSLTGLTPATTYDALIKVTDNGSLSGTAKYLSDGLGNDSKLALSTTAVGIGTTTPSQLLDVQGNSAAVRVAEVGGAEARLVSGGSSSFIGTYSNHPLLILTNSGEKMRIDSAGNVGIGTGSPGEKLTVNGAVGFQQSGSQTYHINPSSNVLTFVRSGIADIMSVTANGLCFGTDTAAANALDDYEEGTFTPTLEGITGTITYSQQTGAYTKIGNVVNVRFRITINSYTSTAGATPYVSMPFTSANVANTFNNSAIFIENTTYVGQTFIWLNANSSQGFMASIATGGAFTHITHSSYTATTRITGNITYFV